MIIGIDWNGDTQATAPYVPKDTNLISELVRYTTAIHCDYRYFFLVNWGDSYWVELVTTIGAFIRVGLDCLEDLMGRVGLIIQS